MAIDTRIEKADIYFCLRVSRDALQQSRYLLDDWLRELRSCRQQTALVAENVTSRTIGGLIDCELTDERCRCG